MVQVGRTINNMAQQKTYYDDSGNPIKQYYDENGNPTLPKTQLSPTGVSNSLVAPDAPIRKLQIDPVSIVSGAAGVASGMGAAGAGLEPFASIIGSGTMSAVDKLLRGITGEYQPENATQVVTDTAKDALLNEVVGKVADFALAKGTAAYDAITNPKNIKFASDATGLNKLKPTFSQLLRGEDKPFAGIAKGFEDLFAPTDKAKALQVSFEAAKDEGDKFIENLTSRKGVSLDQPDNFSRLIKSGEEQTFLKLKNESTARGEAAKLIAEANPEVTPVLSQRQVGKDPLGKPIFSNVRTGEKVVKGPISPENTILYAKKLLDGMDTPLIGPDPASPARKALQDVLERSNAKFDSKGNLVSYTPIGFADMWETKKIADSIGQGNPMVSSNFVDSRFKGLSTAINQDVESSLPNWKVQGDKALALWQDSKSIVAQRETLFNPTGETGKSLNTLLNQIDDPKPSLNAIFDDTKKTQQFLNTGTVVIPDRSSTTGNFTPIKIISNNARKDAQGYTLMRFMNEATVPNAADPTKNVFDAGKLFSLINDPNRQEVLTKIYGSQGLSNVKQFFKNIALTSQKNANSGATRYLGLKIAAGTLSLGSGIASAWSSGSLPTGAITGGAILTASIGAHELAKSLVNPESARIWLAMAQGTPLNMSTQMASRVLANSLRNQPVSIQYSDGTSVEGKFNNLGKFTIPLGSSKVEGTK